MAIPAKLLDAFAILAAQPECAMARAELAARLERSEKQLRRIQRAYTGYRDHAPRCLPLRLPDLRERVRFGRKWWQLVPFDGGLDAAWFSQDSAVVDAELAIWSAPSPALTARLAALAPSARRDRPTHVRRPLAPTAAGVGWVLSWGEMAEVLGPPELRDAVAAVVARLATRYADRT